MIQIFLLSFRDLAGNSGKELFGLLFGSLTLRDILLDFLFLFSRLNSLIWIKFVHESLVFKWVPSLSWMKTFFLFLISQNTLDLIRVNNGVDVSDSNNLSFESIISLFTGSFLSSELFSKFSHSTLSIDSESSELTTWSKSSKIKSLDMDDVNSWNVSKSSS